jgi:pyrroline-5-carboxylate reductase
VARKIGIIGCGRMGESLLQGWLRAGWEPEDIVVAERSQNGQAAVRKAYSVDVVSQASDAVGGSDVLILAVKPQDVPTALRSVSWEGEKRKLLISVCAGVSLASLEEMVKGPAVVRAMPNLPVKLGEGAIGLAGGYSAKESDVVEAEAVLSMLGVVKRVEENLLDTVTAISGNGPAYLFLLAESMIEAGVSCGLSYDVSSDLTRKTLVGAAMMLGMSDETPAALRRGVTSPAGTSAAALRVFERRAFRSMVLDAVHSAAERSRELARDIAASLSSRQD